MSSSIWSGISNEAQKIDRDAIWDWQEKSISKPDLNTGRNLYDPINPARELLVCACKFVDNQP